MPLTDMFWSDRYGWYAIHSDTSGRCVRSKRSCLRKKSKPECERSTPNSHVMKLLNLLSLLALTCVSVLSAQTASPSPDRWQDISFLFGDWEGQGQGATG
jgi:hypothetical protein